MKQAVLALVSFVLSLVVLAACGSSEGSERLAGSFTYIALGDSLSAGIGASDPEATGFVSLVHQSFAEDVELLNLGHSGDTSQELLDHGHLDEAIAEIEERNSDEDATNDVELVTLEIGGNDLLRLYFSLVVTGTCPDLESAIEKAECVDALASALEEYEPNLVTALDRLREAEPSLTIALLTLYNPFSGFGGPGEVGDLGLDGLPDTPFPDGLNDIVRRQAQQRELILVDVFPLFDGRAGELIAGDLIHPNDQGHQVMADAVIDALNGLP